MRSTVHPHPRAFEACRGSRPATANSSSRATHRSAENSIEQTIDIPAPPDAVWDVVVATDQYDQWNPFMPRLERQLQSGHRLTVTIRPKKKTMTFKPTVVAFEPGRLVRWQGHLGVRGIFDGEHELRLDPTPEGGTRFTRRETFTCVLIPLMSRTLGHTGDGFAEMNQALRDRTLSQGSQ